jgi:hypothetical protein
MKQKANELHKSLTGAENNACGPIDEVVAKLDSRARMYRREEEEKRRAEALVLQAEADKRAADRLIEEAIVVEALVGKEAGEAVLNEKVVAPIVVAAPAVQKIEGISFRETWKAEVHDFKALCRAVADGAAPLDCLKVDTAKLNAMARSMKDALVIPGVRVVKDETTSGRSARSNEEEA